VARSEIVGHASRRRTPTVWGVMSIGYLKRLAFIPTVVLVSIVVFAVMHILPGDRAAHSHGRAGEGRHIQAELRRCAADRHRSAAACAVSALDLEYAAGDFGQSFSIARRCATKSPRACR
jgi:ABC-type dipeptide/oligopeptide/nickel transport system permease component